MKDRQLQLTDNDFTAIQKIVLDETGICLTEKKKELVINRLFGRLQRLGIDNFSEYLSFFEKNTSSELPDLINVITTNLTYFNRESHHFDYIENEVLPKFHAECRNTPLLVLSAGCSTGEEALSLVMMLERFKAKHPFFKYKIDGVDIDENVIKFARRGIYSASAFEVETVRVDDVRRCFNKGVESNTGFYSLKKELHHNVTFSQGSIFEGFNSKVRYDIVFCRNVLIYFNSDTQLKALQRFWSAMKPEGYLFLGHSESMQGRKIPFKLLGQTIYRKTP